VLITGFTLDCKELEAAVWLVADGAASNATASTGTGADFTGAGGAGGGLWIGVFVGGLVEGSVAAFVANGAGCGWSVVFLVRSDFGSISAGVGVSDFGAAACARGANCTTSTDSGRGNGAEFMSAKAQRATIATRWAANVAVRGLLQAWRGFCPKVLAKGWL